MKKYKLYNQNDYGHVPYPHAAHPKATVKTSGCGVCCASMVVENLTGRLFPPQEAAAYAIENGARVPGGTDMGRLAKCLCRTFGLKVKTSDRVSELVAHLKANGVSIVNTGGDRSGHKGVFSNGGHYLTVLGINGGELIIGDPGLYDGKYDKPYRKAVTVSGKVCLAAPAVLDEDCKNRSPRYYLFKREGEENMTQEQFNSMMEAYLAQRGREEASGWAESEIEKAKSADVTDGSRPKAFATREEVMAMIVRAGAGIGNCKNM